MELIDYIDTDEGYEEPTVPACFQCKAEQRYGAILSEITLDEGVEVLACDECAAAERRAGEVADELAQQPSCPAREAIVNEVQSVRQLVASLRLHDRRCKACQALTGIGYCDDCDAAVPVAELVRNEAFDLDFCAKCEATARRLDAIVATHNAERAAA